MSPRTCGTLPAAGDQLILPSLKPHDVSPFPLYKQTGSVSQPGIQSQLLLASLCLLPQFPGMRSLALPQRCDVMPSLEKAPKPPLLGQSKPYTQTQRDPAAPSSAARVIPKAVAAAPELDSRVEPQTPGNCSVPQFPYL